MTPEQIKKHKEVIKWFCDNPDKGVWRKDTPTNDWYIDNTPAWYEDYIYVQKDEYAEFRKALADGETVQLDNQFEYDSSKLKTWIEVDEISDHIPVAHYRIKSDESKFKTGDWVYCTSKQGTTTLRQFKKEMIEWVNIYRLTKWEPKENELCVFWDNNCDEYYIGRYGAVCFKETFGDEFGNHYRYLQQKGDWGNIAPLKFIETLKEK